MGKPSPSYSSVTIVETYGANLKLVRGHTVKWDLPTGGENVVPAIKENIISLVDILLAEVRHFRKKL